MVLDAPVNYDSDAFHFVATPNIRYGNASGYSSVTSNLLPPRHQRAARQRAGLDQRDGGALPRLLAPLCRRARQWRRGPARFIGVRHQLAAPAERTASGAAGREHLPDALRGECRGDKPHSPTTARFWAHLVDYRYTTFSPALAYAESERNTVRLIGAVGRYEALDGVSASNNANLQLGFDRQLSEIWMLKTTAGYSRAENRYNYFFGNTSSSSIDSTQNGTVYSANLLRQSERPRAQFRGVSRALAPTGFAYLARQQSVNAPANYTCVGTLELRRERELPDQPLSQTPADRILRAALLLRRRCPPAGISPSNGRSPCRPRKSSSAMGSPCAHRHLERRERADFAAVLPEGSVDERKPEPRRPRPTGGRKFRRYWRLRLTLFAVTGLGLAADHRRSPSSGRRPTGRRPPS